MLTNAELLSTWLMTTAYINGGEQWLDNILAFSRASRKLDGPLEDNWHGHGLGKRSAQRLNCLVVGSEPERYLERFPGPVQSVGQTVACQTQWTELNALIGCEYSR